MCPPSRTLLTVPRGITAKELLSHPLWWHGPPWLLDEDFTPPPMPAQTKQKEEEVIQYCNVALMHPGDSLERSSNSYTTVVRRTCWIRRFLLKSQRKTVPPDKHLTVAEGIAAEVLLQRRSQLRTYQSELQSLTAKPPQPVNPKCKLLSLHPQLNKRGLLSVGGRLCNSLVPEAQRHPVILSSRDILPKLLFDHYHEQLGHGGTTAILSHSGNLFHIIGARKLARATCSKCIDCRKAAVKAGPQLMGQLPPSRLDPDFVFFHTGVDYCGPFTTRAGHTRKPVRLKTYLAVFVCFYTKAVHLELVRDATTESFVACLTRFCSRRGLPLVIHSDNGSNFIGAKHELSELYDMLQQKETEDAIQSYLFTQQVSWKNIPERAPHMGGLWEAAVKAAKFHLKRVVGKQELKYDELETVICQVEACLNSRPLGSMCSHPIDGLCPLTPGHFLIGRALKAYPVDKILFNPTPLQRWVHCQKMTQSFWTRWSQEYLQQLQRAVKWHRKGRNHQVGDIVMLTDGNVFQQQWSMARVIAVYPGKDGVVRAVDVQVETAILPKNYDNKLQLAQNIKTRTAVYRRPVHKLVMLLAVDEVPEGCQMSIPSPEDLLK